VSEINRADALAPWLQRQLAALLEQRGHAWLLHGPSGLGQYDLALALARAWLCEKQQAQGACGRCPSCHAIDVRTHADLCVLMPEVSLLDTGWPLSEKAQTDIDEKKRKPSREIRIDAMRETVEFAQRTSARGRGKVVLVYPAQDMNTITANALLKTLEEPAGDVRFILACSAVDLLLPTVRSRCMAHAMVWPASAEALAWLGAHGMDGSSAQVLLAATGARPADALAWHARGRTAAQWTEFPQAMARGQVAFVNAWTGPELIDALHKLSHDILVGSSGATPRFFPAHSVPRFKAIAAISEWSRQLQQARRSMEHPFNPGLMHEALVSQAQIALHSEKFP